MTHSQSKIHVKFLSASILLFSAFSNFLSKPCEDKLHFLSPAWLPGELTPTLAGHVELSLHFQVFCPKNDNKKHQSSAVNLSRSAVMTSSSSLKLSIFFSASRTCPIHSFLREEYGGEEIEKGGERREIYEQRMEGEGGGKGAHRGNGRGSSRDQGGDYISVSFLDLRVLSSI
eukprot:758120-Hanusia_phi.AAC.2